MTPDHERIEELLSVRALGGLEPADERELEQVRSAHGPDCAECARLERETLEVAALLAFSLAPVPVDAGMAERILATDAVTIVPDAPLVTPGPPVGGVAGPTPPSDELSTRRESRSARTWTAVVGVAAVVVAIAVFAATIVGGPVDVTRADLSGRVVRFDTPDGSGGASLAMAYTPGARGAVFWGHGLDDPGEGRTYEIWMIDDGTPIPGGCATPVDGRLALFVDAPIGTTEVMAVTVEPTACPAAPTSDPVLIADLTTA
jgi:hypothetical protein